MWHEFSTLCTGTRRKSLTTQPHSGISSLPYYIIPGVLAFTVGASKTSLELPLVIMVLKSEKTSKSLGRRGANPHYDKLLKQ